MSDFAPGDVVICVDAGPTRGADWDGHRLLVERRLYTIRDVSRSGRGVQLGEVPVPSPKHWHRASRFRKLFTPDAEVSREVIETIKRPAPVKPEAV